MSRKRNSKHAAPEQALGLPSAYEALEKSSQGNWITTPLFGLLLLYLFISVASITDLQLIERRDTIAVPLFSGLTVPFSLVEFAYWVPAGILVGHLLYLLTLRAHALKLHRWIETLNAGTSARRLRYILPHGLFNQAQLDDGFLDILARCLVRFAVFFAPLITLLYIQLRFSDLHAFWLTSYNMGCFTLDLLLIMFFYDDITAKRPAVTKNIMFNFMKDATLWALCLVAMADFLVVRLIASDDAYKSVAAYMKGESAATIIRLIFDKDYHDAYDASFKSPPRYSLPIPLLEASNENIDLNDAQEGALKYTFDENSIIRDFVFARFHACTFKLAKLQHVRMMCADLENVNLDAAIMGGAQLQHSNMKRASLRGTYLGRADFTEADLRYADLTKATLTGATLTRTDLRVSMLNNAKINGEVLLSGKLLRGASMEGTDLSDAHLYSLYLESVNLKNAILKGAMIVDTNLQGADMQDADLRGASFSRVSMQGANLSGCELQGTLFVKCHVNSLNWPKNISGANATIFDFAMKNYWEDFPTEAALDKTHQELTAINYKIDFRARMQCAKKHFEPHFEYSYSKNVSPNSQFTQERINLMNNCDVRIDHLWLQVTSFPTALRYEKIAAHNRAITEHSLKNYPHRLLSLLQRNLDKFPGAKPEASKLPFSTAH